MDFKIYADSIYQKLSDAKMYSDLDEHSIKYALEAYLTEQYNAKIEALNLEVDMERAMGVFRNTDYYMSKVTEIKSHIISITRQLGKTSID